MNGRGMRQKAWKLADGSGLHLYSDDGGDIVLQVRRHVPTDENVLAPSFKVAARLTPAEALRVASEMLAVVAVSLPDGSKAAGGSAESGGAPAAGKANPPEAGEANGT